MRGEGPQLSASEGEDRLSGTDIAGTPRLEELVSAATVREHAQSFQKLSGLGIYVRSSSGGVLSEGTAEQARVLSEALDADGHLAGITEREGAGGTYLLAPIEHDHDVLGWLVAGPTTGSAQPLGARALFEHFQTTFDLVLHAGQRALYASQMHIASIDESYQELLRKNAALEEAYARLQELDHLKSSFLATISHELRTPLTSIIGYSEMLAEGMCGPLTKDQLEFVQTIRQKGDQLLRLILSLLDLSKLESGTLRMHPISVPIEAVVHDAVTTVVPTASKKGVVVSVAPGAPVPALRADPDRLRQVFVNLLDNAVKFTPKGGSVTVEIREVEAPNPEGSGLVLLAPVRREIEVRVRDTGIGIPAHERARIFDPFYQVDQSSTREQGGAGLGLAIVKRIVEAHQGRIRVEGAEPTGTTFVVTFPMLTSQAMRAVRS